MKLSEIFSNNKNIIINTDIDGILSGIILCKYCNCNIVGFTNSKDKVWLADGYDDLYQNIYIDMFVTDDRATCIDQHVVAINEDHIKSIRALGNKFNPQSDDIDNLRFFSKDGFTYKYPFGTFQYLIALLESEGVVITLPDLNKKIPRSKIKLGDLLNRPDDAMKSSLHAYKPNADFWWAWLEKKAPNGCIKELKRYLDDLGSASDAKVKGDTRGIVGKKNELRVKLVEDIKEKTKDYFKTQFQCQSNSGDGGFKDITDENNIILDNVVKFIKTVNSLLEFDEINIPKHYNIHKGQVHRTRWISLFEKEFLKDYTICGHKVFSYAFIYGPGNDRWTNFSFTVDMQ